MSSFLAQTTFASVCTLRWQCTYVPHRGCHRVKR